MEKIALSDSTGVEIRCVDLSREIPNDLWNEIHTAWLEHKVIVLRNQNLSDEDQLRFARSFGELQTVRTATDIVGENQSIMHVANRPVGGKPGILPDGEMHFHNDQSYYECPCKATTLYSIKIPDEGGNTLFLNTAEAYAGRRPQGNGAATDGRYAAAAARASSPVPLVGDTGLEPVTSAMSTQRSSQLS